MLLLEKPLAQILSKRKGWIYPTESTKPIASAPDELRLTPYHSLLVSTIKGTPEAESTQVPKATSTVERVREQTELRKENRSCGRKRT